MKKITALSGFLFISVAIFCQKEDKRFAGLDTAFTRILKEWKGAGFAVAVVEKNKVIYSRGFGYKDLATKAPVTPNTQFAIGSCTKAFTSSLLGLFEKEGKLKFDEAATSYVSNLKFFNENMNAHVTVRDLMTHRTGLPRYDYEWYYFPTPSRDSLVQRIKFMEPTTDIRQTFQYNNFMFLVQGVIAEKLSGKSWEENIRTKIFEPLGMNNSNTTLGEWMKAPDISKGYEPTGEKDIEATDYYDIGAMGPAGSINSSVNDMAKWVIAWINGGKYNGKEILPSQYVNQAITPQIVIPGGLPSKEHPDMHIVNYGFAWGLSSYRGHFRAEHGGNIDGFSASTSFFPSDSIGIIVLSNQSNSMIPYVAGNLIADRVLDLKYHDWQSEHYNNYKKNLANEKDAAKARIENKKPGTKPTLEPRFYEGIYTTQAGEKIEVDLVNDSLIASIPGKKFWLKHFHYDVFEAAYIKNGSIDTAEKNNTKLMFQMDMKGNIASLSINFEGTKPTIFNRTDKARAVSKEELNKYAGIYKLPNMEVKVYVKEALYVSVPGQPEYELVPVGPHKFNIKILPGFSVLFEADNNGKINALTFFQPNGNFKAEKQKQ